MSVEQEVNQKMVDSQIPDTVESTPQLRVRFWFLKIKFHASMRAEISVSQLKNAFSQFEPQFWSMTDGDAEGFDFKRVKYVLKARSNTLQGCWQCIRKLPHLIRNLFDSPTQHRLRGTHTSGTLTQPEQTRWRPAGSECAHRLCCLSAD